MVHKASLQFLVILLVFSFVLSSSAVPTRRRLLSKREESSIKTRLDQLEGVEFRNGEETIDMSSEELMLERRMDMENSDYAGTGANNRHDPKTPGRA